mgnify:CR=1 FL=1
METNFLMVSMLANSIEMFIFSPQGPEMLYQPFTRCARFVKDEGVRNHVFAVTTDGLVCERGDSGL